MYEKFTKNGQYANVIAALLVFIFLGENFALKKPTKQSQTAHGGIASKAVDGNKNSYYYRGSCTHTNEETTPWWRVDLEQRIAVTHVKIVNRAQIGKRLCGFEIRIGDSLKNNGITNPRCGSQQYIPSNQVTAVRNQFFQNEDPKRR